MRGYFRLPYILIITKLEFLIFEYLYCFVHEKYSNIIHIQLNSLSKCYSNNEVINRLLNVLLL